MLTLNLKAGRAAAPPVAVVVVAPLAAGAPGSLAAGADGAAASAGAGSALLPSAVLLTGTPRSASASAAGPGCR
jgi:hypothetical protein